MDMNGWLYLKPPVKQGYLPRECKLKTYVQLYKLKDRTTDSVVFNLRTERNGVLFILPTCMLVLLQLPCMILLELIKPDLSLNKLVSPLWLALSNMSRNFLSLNLKISKPSLTQSKEKWIALPTLFPTKQSQMLKLFKLLKKLELPFIPTLKFF